MILELHDVSYIIQHPPVSIISALAGDLANGFVAPASAILAAIE